METNETAGLVLLILFGTGCLLVVLKSIFYGIGYVIDKIADARSRNERTHHNNHNQHETYVKAKQSR